MKEQTLIDLKHFINKFNDEKKRLPDVADLREFFYDKLKDEISDVCIQETEYNEGKGKMAIFTYKGSGDPVKNLNNAIELYTRGAEYTEFIDANMDNPWHRIIVSGINEITKSNVSS